MIIKEDLSYEWNIDVRRKMMNDTDPVLESDAKIGYEYYSTQDDSIFFEPRSFGDSDFEGIILWEGDEIMFDFLDQNYRWEKLQEDWESEIKKSEVYVPAEYKELELFLPILK
jgi:hypothetical protein